MFSFRSVPLTILPVLFKECTANPKDILEKWSPVLEVSTFDLCAGERMAYADPKGG